MVWITMSLAPHAGNKKRKKNESKPHSQINKCLNEKRRREQENIHIEELAELVSASPSDMSSLSCKPDKCAILKETVNQIRSQKQSIDNELCDDLQQSEVSSSKPNIINNQIFGSILLEALEGFLFVVNVDGKVEFVSENITSFLKFYQDEVYEKSIYDFIHPDDQARFNSNLLLMMPLGNGRDWSSENTFNSGKPTKHFNCRFLVKQDDSEIKMEHKQPHEPQYESLNITANYMPLQDNANGHEETRNGLTCIARRVAFEDKRIILNKVEQFTTRIDRDGKVVDLDANMLSLSNKQYLNKELLNSSMLDFCHPSDLATLRQHIKDTFETEGATSIPYKFRIGQDRYAKIKTKSKRFRSGQSNEEYVVSTHSVIRDSDSSTSALENQHSVSSPSSVASTSSGPSSISDSSTSMNGSVTLSPMGVSNSYGNFSNSLSAGNSSDFALSDLVLEMLPGSTWNLDTVSTQAKEPDCTGVTTFVQSPQTAPLSNQSETSAAASPTNSAFVSGLASSRSGSSATSPAIHFRAPTPYGGSCYSPSGSQSGSDRSSPPRALSAKTDSFNCSSTDSTGLQGMNQGTRLDRQFDMKNPKLRNLLTQNSEASSSASQQNLRQISQDEVMLINSRILDDSSRLGQVKRAPQTNNVILRDLLNQDDEVPVEPIQRHEDSAVPNPFLNAGSCKTIEKSAQQVVGNNQMLRQLLNHKDAESYRKSQDHSLMRQLIIPDTGHKAQSLQNERLISDMVSNQRIENSLPNSLSRSSSHGSPEVTYVSESPATKRKVEDSSVPSTTKKPNTNLDPNHAHLAGQNPMLASMLAQTPRTPPMVVPTSHADSIKSQVPQERLPKNLEKKLVHTPYTAGSLKASTSSNVYSAASTSLQRDIVTSDSRGHIMQQPIQLNIQPGLRTSYSQQQQLLFDKLVSGTDEDLLLAKSMAPELSNLVTTASVQNLTTYSQLLSAFNNQQASAAETVASTSLTALLSDNSLVAQTSAPDPIQTNQGTDSLDTLILEQIYSMQEDHKVAASQKPSNPATILKILNDPMEFPDTNTTSQPVTVNSTQDINEKIAISAIQKELMEAGSAAIASRTGNIQNSGLIPTYSQAGRPLARVTGTPLLQAQLTSEQILMLQQQQQQQHQLVGSSLPPNYSLVANRVRLPVTKQGNASLVNRELLARAQQRNIQLVRGAAGTTSARAAQMDKEFKAKLIQQQKQRLLEQQQNQCLSMQTKQPLDVAGSGGSSYPENMNDLLNNTVAPNVTLLRSSGIPEIPGAARFNLTSANSLPSPTSQQASPTSAQLSPGQRVNQASPFSPLSQQPFPSQTPPPSSSSYQAARLSPHPPPSYPQGGPSHSPSPNAAPASSPHMVLSPQSTTGSLQWTQRIATSPTQNLQLQNPMLNAQLSQQASIGANQIRLTSQQRQQLALRSMPSPNSVQNSRGAVFSSQSDGNFSPVSPIMVLQSQATQQQRVQRVRPLPAMVSSGSQNQQTFSSTDTILSPQPLPSPSYSQSISIAPTSTYVSISTAGVPVTYSIAPASQQFTFERQNVQAYTTSSNESLRSPANDQLVTDSLRQELRSLVNSQNQLVLSSNNQGLLRSLASGSVTGSLNIHSLTREDLEGLGLSVELLPSQAIVGQSGSQALYAQALLNDTSGLENAAQSTSPMVQVEEPKPVDQKKSLLQQLLSEPT